MRSLYKILLVLGFFLLIGAVFTGYYFFFRQTKAGLLVDTTPAARVLIDGKEMGKTRFDLTTEAREVTLKLIPISDTALPPYETKITLVPGVKTVYQRTFSAQEETASDALISYEKTGLSTAALSVTTIPSTTWVTIDEHTREAAPFRLDNLKEGNHTLVVTADGFLEKKLLVKNKRGYKLIVAVTLAKTAEVKAASTEEILATSTPQPKIFVTILDTPTGFLRVRAEASTLGAEVGQVIPGKKYELVRKDETTGWFLIRFGDQEGKNQEGWISNKYAVLDDHPAVENENHEQTPEGDGDE